MKLYKMAFLLPIILLIGYLTTTIIGKNRNKDSTWEKYSTFFSETVGNSDAYNVEAAGWNVRVIEWIPKGNTGYRCMFVAGTDKAGSSCYPFKK